MFSGPATATAAMPRAAILARSPAILVPCSMPPVAAVERAATCEVSAVMGPGCGTGTAQHQ
ncbi:hypothetical protein Acsp03_21130 [Actinomadura sp. NBRC 104412]|nr:hypothetical protein Acsp03_21130 [Actinomadura sp. NBRC 104412]